MDFNLLYNSTTPTPAYSFSSYFLAINLKQTIVSFYIIIALGLACYIDTNLPCKNRNFNQCSLAFYGFISNVSNRPDLHTVFLKESGQSCSRLGHTIRSWHYDCGTIQHSSRRHTTHFLWILHTLLSTNRDVSTLLGLWSETISSNQLSEGISKCVSHTSSWTRAWPWRSKLAYLHVSRINALVFQIVTEHGIGTGGGHK